MGLLLSKVTAVEPTAHGAVKIAVKTAMQLIHQRFELSESNPTDVIIFSDSKSALEALLKPPY